MRPRLKLDFWMILFCALVPMTSFAVQEDLPDPEAKMTSLVEIEYPPQLLLPYRERRGTWAPILGFKYENYVPSSYKSEFTTADPYSDMFGDQGVALVGLSGGAKYNLPFGSLTGEVSLTSGSLTDGRIGDNVTLEMKKYGAHFGFWLDTLMPEPYVVPYVQADIFQISYEENDKAANGQSFSGSGQSGVLFGYTAGVLIQLNWIDPEAALQGLVSAGINNSYLDLFVSQASGDASGEDGRGNFSSDPSWGGGVRVEF